MTSARARAGLVPLLLLLLSSTVGGCSAILNFQKDQCHTDLDCTALGAGFEKSKCGADNVCTHPSADGGEGCVSNKKCVDDNGALPYACITPGSPCVSLLSQDCTQVIGDFTSDSTVFYGDLANVAAPEVQEVAQNFLNALTMAVREFNQQSSGLVNPGHPNRSPVFVVCDDTKDPTRALRHLIDDVHVPASIVDADTTVTLDLATKTAIPANVMVIAPNDSSPQIRDFGQKQGLVWTTTSSDDQLAIALTKVIPQEEAQIRSDRGIPNPGTNPLKLALVTLSDGLNQSLANTVESNITWNGGKTPIQNGTNYLRVNTGDQNNPNFDFTPDINRVIAQQPDIIVAFGSSVVLGNVLLPVEQQWPAGQPRPTYAATEGMLIPALLEAVGDQPNLKTRFRAVRRVPRTGDPRDGFVLRYRGANNNIDPLPGVDRLYDATYLLLFATVAASGAPTLNGKALADQIPLLNPPAVQKILIKPDDINKAFQILVTKNAIDLDGTASNLDYNLSTGVVKYEPLEVSCISAPLGKAEYVSAGQTFDVDLNLSATPYTCP